MFNKYHPQFVKKAWQTGKFKSFPQMHFLRCFTASTASLNARRLKAFSCWPATAQGLRLIRIGIMTASCAAQINSEALKTCHDFMLMDKRAQHHTDIIGWILKAGYCPVRAGRNYERKKSPHGAKSFNCRWLIIIVYSNLFKRPLTAYSPCRFYDESIFLMTFYPESCMVSMLRAFFHATNLMTLIGSCEPTSHWRASVFSSAWPEWTRTRHQYL